MGSVSYLAFVIIFLISLLSSIQFSSDIAYATPQGIVSHECGPLGEFEMRFDVNGFLPDYFVSWNFTGPDGVRLMHGYFATNATGGFSEDAELDSIITGNHTLNLFDDLEHDYFVDVNGNVARIPIPLPCN